MKAHPYEASTSKRNVLPRKASKLCCKRCLCILVAVAVGSIGLLFFMQNNSNLQRYYLKPKLKNDSGINKEDKGGDREELPLNSSAAEFEFETTGKSQESPSTNANDISTDTSIEQNSRAYPIWADKRRTVDSSSHPYGWCVPEDLATNNDKSPKGLLFVKVHKCSSSTGAGVTLRIQDRLSKRLHQNQTSTSTCYAHYDHATARDLRFQKRDPAQSFLWSIVREPAQRTLR